MFYPASEISMISQTEPGREQNPSCQDLFVCLLNLLQCIAVNSFSRKGPCLTLRFEDWKFGWCLPQCALLVPLKAHMGKFITFSELGKLYDKWVCGKSQKLIGPRWWNSVISLENFIFRWMYDYGFLVFIYIRVFFQELPSISFSLYKFFTSCMVKLRIIITLCFVFLLI